MSDHTVRRSFIIHQALGLLQAYGDSWDTWQRIGLLTTRWAKDPGFRSDPMYADSREQAAAALIAEIKAIHERPMAEQKEQAEHDALRQAILEAQRAEGLV